MLIVSAKSRRALANCMSFVMIKSILFTIEMRAAISNVDCLKITQSSAPAFAVGVVVSTVFTDFNITNSWHYLFLSVCAF